MPAMKALSGMLTGFLPVGIPFSPTVVSPATLQQSSGDTPENMPSNSPSLHQGRNPVSTSNLGCEGISCSSPSGTVPTALECHVKRQAILSKQTPYERRRSGFSPGDTGILLGQRDFNATLSRPGVRRFASVRQPTREEQPLAKASSGLGNKAWGKICSWGKITFGRGKSSDGKKTNEEGGPTGRCYTDELAQDATQGRGTGREPAEAPGSRLKSKEARRGVPPPSESRDQAKGV
ncbi:hypothetical protein, conserved [Eimeria acervulina]|uniref:Uncharacterized protein n=1 Tax=Eimeria acervulina TaxID=5801 RepID=U6GHQ1_EIMAC|nr:hypothetical protein, conserved [Eimeria acervulina]CDI78818.1 hypothetical protein, conserved [Eimeria acervulina]